MSLLTFAAIAALLQAACAALDLLLLKRQRAKVQVSLIAAWARLDDLRTPDLPSHLAHRMAPFFRALVGRRVLSVRAVIGAFAWSTLAAIAGFFAYGQLTLGYDSTYMLWLSGPWKTFWAAFMFANALTAVPSLLITAWMIIGAANLAPKRLALRLLIGLTASAILALLNFHWNTRIAGSGNFSIDDFPYVSLNTINSFFKGELDPDFAQHIAISIASFTIDLVFLAALLLLLVGKLAVSLARLAVMQLLEAASEKSVESLAPFTILGIFLNLVGALLKLIAELLR